MRGHIVTRHTRTDGYLRCERIAMQVTMPNGAITPVHDRDCVLVDDSVAVLPYDPRKDGVVLIEQIRVGALVRDDTANGIVREVVAGTIDAGETKDAAARRETTEETGLAVTALQYVGDYALCPGYSNEQMTLYCACVDSHQLSAVAGESDEQECIVPRYYPAAMVDDIFADTVTLSMPTVALLYWFKANQAMLRQRWRS